MVKRLSKADKVSLTLYIYSFVVRTLHADSRWFQVWSTSCIHNLLYSYYHTHWQDIPICCSHHVTVVVWKYLLSFIGNLYPNIFISPQPRQLLFALSFYEFSFLRFCIYMISSDITFCAWLILLKEISSRFFHVTKDRVCRFFFFLDTQSILMQLGKQFLHSQMNM